MFHQEGGQKGCPCTEKMLTEVPQQETFPGDIHVKQLITLIIPVFCFLNEMFSFSTYSSKITCSHARPFFSNNFIRKAQKKKQSSRENWQTVRLSALSLPFPMQLYTIKSMLLQESQPAQQYALSTSYIKSSK